MKLSKYVFFLILTSIISCTRTGARDVDITLIPPVQVSNKVDLDVRMGVVNNNKFTNTYKLKLILRNVEEERVVKEWKVKIMNGSTYSLSYKLPTADMCGKYEVELVASSLFSTSSQVRKIEVIPSDKKSLGTIDGAWVGLSPWSDTQGKNWKSDICQLTDEDWRGVVRSMHHIGMNIIVVQELFRKDAYSDQHSMTANSYDGKAFYPSNIYPERMGLQSEDPLEAIMDEADKLDMCVLPGIGLYAWFDFSEESLVWHQRVTEEVYKRYGHHPSFYGFYLSEEAHGSLDNGCPTEELRKQYTDEIVSFFENYTAFCGNLAPSKPVMLATNCFNLEGRDAAYASLLKNIDILCPFGFTRMPTCDLSGKDAADLLQTWCDAAGAHLWLDLEAFSFNPDGSLSPMQFDKLKSDVLSYDSFEKTLCYQYTGLFNNPAYHPQIGEDSSIELYSQYMAYEMYKEWLKPYSLPPGAKIVKNPEGILDEDDKRSDCVEILLSCSGDSRIVGRVFQGVPTIAATDDGHVVYVAWFGGGMDEEMGNYITVSVSDNGGRSWNYDELVVFPKDPKIMRVFDPVLWSDKDGVIHLKYSVTISDQGEVIDPYTSSHEMTIKWNGGKMEFSYPSFLTYGLMVNPPLELSGDKCSLYPISRCTMNHNSKPLYHENPNKGTFVYKKEGDAFKLLSTFTPVDYSLYDFEECSFAPLDSTELSLMCVARFRGGLRKSFSHDGGVTWSVFEEMPEIGASTSSRALLKRLQSGRLMLLYNNAPDRSNMTIALSEDKGISWPHKIVVDKRAKTSYPACRQLADGTILMVYDRDRYGDMDILFTRFSEQDIIDGNVPTVQRITD